MSTIVHHFRSKRPKRFWNFNFPTFLATKRRSPDSDIYIFLDFFSHVHCLLDSGHIIMQNIININKFRGGNEMSSTDYHSQWTFILSHIRWQNKSVVGAIVVTTTPNKCAFSRAFGTTRERLLLLSLHVMCVYRMAMGHNRHITMHTQTHKINLYKNDETRARMQDINSIMCNLILIFPFMNTLSTRLI